MQLMVSPSLKKDTPKNGVTSTDQNIWASRRSESGELRLPDIHRTAARVASFANKATAIVGATPPIHKMPKNASFNDMLTDWSSAILQYSMTMGVVFGAATTGLGLLGSLASVVARSGEGLGYSLGIIGVGIVTSTFCAMFARYARGLREEDRRKIIRPNAKL